jgi:diguanylate cyclase (GGDEF)-like protein
VADHAPLPEPPLALIANDEEWFARSLETILGVNGYGVLRVHTGREALERAERADVIILDAHLPDIDGLEVCRTLSGRDGGAPPPILMTSSNDPTRQQRREALRAGAREFFALPLDSEEFFLRLNGYVREKQRIGWAREEGLLDETTGLYNLRGLGRRAAELGADALRRRTPLACVVLGVDNRTEAPSGIDDSNPPFIAPLPQIGRLLQSTARASDAVGRLGPQEFAVLAPATGPEGAARLAGRLATAIETELPAIRTHAGYEDLTDFRTPPAEPVELLIRATTALRTARAAGDRESMRRYEEPPPAP